MRYAIGGGLVVLLAVVRVVESVMVLAVVLPVMSAVVIALPLALVRPEVLVFEVLVFSVSYAVLLVLQAMSKMLEVLSGIVYTVLVVQVAPAVRWAALMLPQVLRRTRRRVPAMYLAVLLMT